MPSGSKILEIEFRRGGEYPPDLEILGDTGIQEDENGLFVRALVRIPINETNKERLERSKPAAITLDWRCDPLEPADYDRIIQDGLMLHVLDEKGEIINSFNTTAPCFVAVRWYDKNRKKESYEEIAKKCFEGTNSLCPGECINGGEVCPCPGWTGYVKLEQLQGPCRYYSEMVSRGYC
jgi:hypothetical protein